MGCCFICLHRIGSPRHTSVRSDNSTQASRDGSVTTLTISQQIVAWMLGTPCSDNVWTDVVLHVGAIAKPVSARASHFCPISSSVSLAMDYRRLNEPSCCSFTTDSCSWQAVCLLVSRSGWQSSTRNSRRIVSRCATTNCAKGCKRSPRSSSSRLERNGLAISADGVFR